MNEQQRQILDMLETELQFKFNEDIINELLSNRANFFSMQRQAGKTYHIMAAIIIISLSETDKKIKVYVPNYISIDKYNYQIFSILEGLKVKNYNFIHNDKSSYSIYNINNNRIEVEKKINNSTYIEESDYIFIDELYTIEYKTEFTVQKMLLKTNKSVNIFATLPMECQYILENFYDLNFNFKFIKGDNDFENNYALSPYCTEKEK